MPRAKSIAARRSDRTREKNSVCFCLCCFFFERGKVQALGISLLRRDRDQLSSIFARAENFSLRYCTHSIYIQFSLDGSYSSQKAKASSSKNRPEKRSFEVKRREKKEIFQPTDKYTTDYMKMKRNICMSQVSLFARTAAYAAAALAMVFACLALVVCARLWAQFDRGKL